MASTLLFDLPVLHGFPLQPATIAIIFSLLSVFLLFCFYPNRSSSKRPKLPPSPPKLPFVGNLHQVTGSPLHHSLRALSKEYGPLMLLQLGQVPTLVVSSAEMAEEVMKTHDLAFASRPRSKAGATITGGLGLALSPYGEYWRQARRITTVHLLSASRVLAFRPAREEAVARLVGRISELSPSGEAVNMSRQLSSLANGLICRAAVGRSAMEGGAGGEITELAARSTEALLGFHVENFFPSLAWLSKFTGMDAELSELCRRWRAVLGGVIAGATAAAAAAAAGDRVEEEGGGFLDVLLSLQREDAAARFNPSRDELEGILRSLINAGTETSSLVLEEALKELIRNPSAMKKAQGEVRGAVQGKSMVEEDDIRQMPYLNAVLKEALRLHPPAPLLLHRESMAAVQMRGYDIPAKTRIIVNAWAIARDPKHWEMPEEFRPERFLNSSIDFRGNSFQYTPFGAGRRICPGIQFAMATMEVTLANLLYHFNWSLPEGVSAEDFDVDERAGHPNHKRPSLLLVAKSKSV